MPKSTLLHTRTDSHFFSPSKCRPDGGGMEAFRRYNSGGKSRFLVSLLKIYTNIALASLAQVRAQAFYQLKITLFTVGQQAENFPLNIPFLLYRRIRFQLFVGHFATFPGSFPASPRW